MTAVAALHKDSKKDLLQHFNSAFRYSLATLAACNALVLQWCRLSGHWAVAVQPFGSWMESSRRLINSTLSSVTCDLSSGLDTKETGWSAGGPFHSVTSGSPAGGTAVQTYLQSEANPCLLALTHECPLPIHYQLPPRRPRAAAASAPLARTAGTARPKMAHQGQRSASARPRAGGAASRGLETASKARWWRFGDARRHAPAGHGRPAVSAAFPARLPGSRIAAAGSPPGGRR